MPDPPELPHAAAPVITLSRLRVGLGTFIAVEADAGTPGVGERGIRAAFQAVAATDRLLHPTRAGSDIATINACTPGTPLAVHPWTWAVLALCKRLQRASQGGFDPCLPKSGSLDDLELLPVQRRSPRHRVMLRSSVHLDLGGIGKGFAVDRAIDALRAAGCRAGLVNAGGDLAVFGEREQVVVCRDLRRGVATLSLREAALASSDVASPSRPAEHRGYYDGVDPSRSVAGQVTVTAPSAAVADGLTKCLLIDAANTTLLDAFDARRIGW